MIDVSSLHLGACSRRFATCPASTATPNTRRACSTSEVVDTLAHCLQVILLGTWSNASRSGTQVALAMCPLLPVWTLLNGMVTVSAAAGRYYDK